MIIKLEIECPKCKSKNISVIKNNNQFYNCDKCDNPFVIDITYHFVIKNVEISTEFIDRKVKK